MKPASSPSMAGRRLSPAIRHWMGESRGRWQGTTLVVETTNFNGRSPMMVVGPGGNPIPTSESLRIVERFARVADDRLENELPWRILSR